jgi:hypothetical protein
MPYQLNFIPHKLDKALNDAAARHFTTAECARQDYGERLGNFIKRAEAMEENFSEEASVSIRNSELELLLHAIKNTSSQDLSLRLRYILEKRAKVRLFDLNWLMLQEDYENEGLLASMKILSIYMNKNFHGKFQASLYSKLDNHDTGILPQSLDLLYKEGMGITDFIKQYGIQPLSSFGCSLCARYFRKCDKQGFKEDCDLFQLYINNYNGSDIYPAVAYYLDTLQVSEYLDEINLQLLSRFSHPSSGNCLWDNIIDSLKQKFNQWMRIKEIEKHFGGDQRKYAPWKQVYSYIDGVWREKEDNLLFIDLGEYVAVDMGLSCEDAFLYRKSIFNVLYEQYIAGKESGLKWSNLPEGVVTARDAIILDTTSDSYKISYEGIGVLYIKELIEKDRKGVGGHN